jgi:CRP-like cAMP-binding protein
MSLDSDISLLAHVPLFSQLNAEQLRLLAFSAVHREIRADEVLFREGEDAQSGFIVASGEILMTQGDGKARKVLATCEPGCLIGELALFISAKRPATAVAGRLSDVMEINRALVTRMLNEYPHVALRLRAALAERLTATVGELGKVQQALEQVSSLTTRPPST